MTIGVQIFALVVALASLALVFFMLRRKSFRERHAVWYLVAALGAVFVAIFPGVMEWAAELIGVAEPLNLVFFVSLMIMFLIAVQLSSELTSVEARIRRLAEETAMHDLQVRELEQRLDELECSRDGRSAGQRPNQAHLDGLRPGEDEPDEG